MIEAAFPTDEDARLRALARYDLLDTPPEEAFDRIAQLARKVFRVPIALVSLVASDRQYLKSCLGLGTRETPRSVSFCAHTILQPEVMVVEDAHADPRFAENPLVTGDPHIRFYAGAPLITSDGYHLGSLCLIDSEVRSFADDERDILAGMAEIVVHEMEQRRALRVSEARVKRLRRQPGS